MVIQLYHISTFNSKHEKQPKPPLPTTKRRPTLQVNAASGSNNDQHLIQSQAIRAIQTKEAVAAIKDSKLLVACGEGRRSIMAATKLYEGGYKNLGWLAGGFNRSGDEDFPEVEGTEKLQYATIGGCSFSYRVWVKLHFDKDAQADLTNSARDPTQLFNIMVDLTATLLLTAMTKLTSEG